ncbi:MAG: hypothetical protein J0I80_07660 [Sphingomonas sp.]|nr:hypothetical protein [Sphingomonas sp.]
MIFHISLSADDPGATADFFARLWQGRAYPFPPFGQGSWVAMAGDERNSAIEIYPRGTEMHFGGADSSDVREGLGAPVREQACHAAIASPLAVEAVLALAAEAGYPARVCDRGPFHLIEVWIDGCFMIEVLTPEMQAEYLGSMTLEGWEGFLAAAA